MTSDTTITPELLDQLLANYEKPEDLTGADGLFKQLKKDCPTDPVLRVVTFGPSNTRRSRPLANIWVASRRISALDTCGGSARH